MPYPWFGPPASVRRTSRSSVPGRSSAGVVRATRLLLSIDDGNSRFAEQPCQPPSIDDGSGVDGRRVGLESRCVLGVPSVPKVNGILLPASPYRTSLE